MIFLLIIQCTEKVVNINFDITTATSVSMIKNIGGIPIYSSSITGNIPILSYNYHSNYHNAKMAKIKAITPCKNTGVIEYVPSSGTYPTTGNWEVGKLLIMKVGKLLIMKVVVVGLIMVTVLYITLETWL
jgi:hypothetical protein